MRESGINSTMGVPASITALAREVLPMLHRQASAQHMLACVESIVSSDRWNSFDRFHETAQTIARAYESAGAVAQIDPIHTGGDIGSGRWIIQEAADVRLATLDVAQPVQRGLGDYHKNPWHVVQWTTSTPAGGVVCELVAIDSEEELNRLRRGALAGRMVLTRLNVGDYRARFCEKGALGVVSDAGAGDCPDATAWVKFGWGGLSIDSAAARLVGLAVPSRQGQGLRQLLRENRKVTVRVNVDVRRYCGTHDVVSGLIAGRDDPQDEVWAVAHSYEPGALDNASGVAACVEIARLLNDLIARRQLARPRHSIRLVNAYECYGFFPYLECRKRLQPPLAGVCIDTIGAKAQVCKGALKWHATVPQSAGFVNDLGEELIRSALAIDDAGYHYEPKPFASTEDTLLGDPKHGFPCPWLTNHPFTGYHSSADTVELLEPRGLVTCTAAMAAYLYYLADAGTAEALELANWQTEKTVERLESAQPPCTLPQTEYIRGQHAADLKRLGRWLWGGERGAIVAAFAQCEKRVADAAARNCAPLAPSSEWLGPGSLMQHVPVRRAPLAPTSENVRRPIAERINSLPKWAVYWADGQRSLHEIADMLWVELNKPIQPQKVMDFFQALAELGYVRLMDPSEMLGQERLADDLRALGVRTDMDVMVHSSLSRIGPVRGGADAVVNAMLSVIAPGGTLLAPSFNHSHAKVFNPLATPTTNGAIAEAIWRRPEAMRSVQASHAVAAIGPRAAEYTADHLTNGIWAPNSPIGRLVHNGGYILAIGVSNETSTAYHVAEISLGAPCLDQFGDTDRIVLPDGTVKEVPGLAWRADNCPVDVKKKLDEALDARGLQSHGKVGRADATLVRALDLWTMRREHIQNVCPACTIRPHPRR